MIGCKLIRLDPPPLTEAAVSACGEGVHDAYGQGPRRTAPIEALCRAAVDIVSEPARDPTTDFVARMITRRRFASLRDVIDHIQTHYSGQGPVAAFFRAPSTDDDPNADPYLHLNVISFVVRGEEVTLFPTFERVQDEMEALAETEGVECYEYDNLIVFYPGSFSSEEADGLATVLISFYLACDVDGNQIEGAVRRLVRRSVEVPHNLPTISDAISSRFQVMAPYYLVKETRTPGRYQITPRAQDPLTAALLDIPEVQSDAHESVRTGLSYSGRVTHDGTKYYYKVVPVIHIDAHEQGRFVFDPGAHRITKVRPSLTLKRQAAIVLIDREAIGALCFHYARGMVDMFAGAASHATKARVMQEVARLRADAQLDLLESPFSGVKHQRARIRAFAQAVCAALIQVTSAHSATVRFFDPFSQTLEVEAAAFCDSLSEESAVATPIDVDPENSLNAFVFRSVTDPQGIYIRDVRDPLPEPLLGRGLKALLICRPETMSEICIPIRKTGLTIGVVNVEAGTDHAFDRDEAFIQWIARQLGEYVDVVTRSSDAGWLPRLSFAHFAAHRMSKVERKLKDHPEVLEVIKSSERRISTDFIDPGEIKLVRTSKLMSRVRAFIGRSRRQLVAGLEIVGAMPEHLPPRVAHSLEVVLENLLQNARQHDGRRFPVRMEFTEEGGDAGLPGSHLTITYTAGPEDFVSAEEADWIGIAPRFDPGDRTYHLGTFLAGVHVRLLGGMMWVLQEKIPGGGVPFRYVVQIPLNSAPAQGGN